MNIQEVENLTGITKQNIRFYEKEGLIAPKRNAMNGYREYGEEDIHSIKIIKLLRKLDMPLQEIRSVLEKEEPLEIAVKRQQERLEAAKSDLEAAISSCRKISEYQLDSLDVDKELAVMEEVERHGGKFAELWNDFKTAATMEKSSPDKWNPLPNEFESEERNKQMKRMRLFYRLVNAFFSSLVVQGLGCVLLGMNQKGILTLILMDVIVYICGSIWWWKKVK